jgi:glycosyltransferase involved in cell wall biosynthesis
MDGVAPRERTGPRTAGGLRPLFLSAYGTEPCGVPAFVRDLADAYDLADGRAVAAVVTVARAPAPYLKDDRVLTLVRNDENEACRDAAALVNEHPCTVVNLHQESGCHPGAWGQEALGFARACRKPMVVTFHTLSARPEPGHRQRVRALAALCERVVVTTAPAAALMAESYGVPARQVVRIPRATHQLSCDEREWLGHRMSIPGGPLLLTAGPLCRQMGIEFMIDAMPRLLDHCPNATYVVVGRTHRAAQNAEGERYRAELRDRAGRLGVLEHLRFVDRSLSLHEMLLYMKSADVFVSPSASGDGIMAGTMAYAAAAGRPVVATPCLYAREMAAGRALVLADGADGAALAAAVLRVLNDAPLRARLEQAALGFSEGLRWDRVAGLYRDLFRSLAAAPVPRAQEAV